MKTRRCRVHHVPLEPAGDCRVCTVQTSERVKQALKGVPARGEALRSAVRRARGDW